VGVENIRLPGAFVDTGDPDEYGVTILVDETDEPMAERVAWGAHNWGEFPWGGPREI
jgi:hypothetical protein